VWYNINTYVWDGDHVKPVGPQQLATQRLILRPPQMEDTEALVRIKSLPMSLTEGKKAVASMVDELRKPFTFHWIITLDGTVIGRIKAWDVNPYNGNLQLGYDVGPEYRGRGFGAQLLGQAVMQTRARCGETLRITVKTGHGSEKFFREYGFQPAQAVNEVTTWEKFIGFDPEILAL